MAGCRVGRKIKRLEDGTLPVSKGGLIETMRGIKCTKDFGKW